MPYPKVRAPQNSPVHRGAAFPGAEWPPRSGPTRTAKPLTGRYDPFPEAANSATARGRTTPKGPKERSDCELCVTSLYSDVSTGMQTGAAPTKNGEEPLSKPLPGGVVVGLEIHLQSKLDLPRIIWCIASRANFSEG